MKSTTFMIKLFSQKHLKLKLFTLFLLCILYYFFLYTPIPRAVRVQRALPPKPWFFERDKTILGIDRNNNGVRDEVEWAISDITPVSEDGKEEEYFENLHYAKVYQDYLVRYLLVGGATLEEGVVLNRRNSCAPVTNRKSVKGRLYDFYYKFGYENYDTRSAVFEETFNTERRRDIYYAIEDISANKDYPELNPNYVEMDCNNYRN